ncbi:Nab2 [Drosophila busckii]|uniref:Zinc finger CCCH domain-containing protein 14 n=1 Tax=Drosophila busckii TaxID=30019 RepID=A0A0M4ENP7_DROBS|nr:zinc finger CCCH domain-containing protein 14 [Drosophila busckii]ALC47277.1 Nab2 [Drosophila busckii]
MDCNLGSEIGQKMRSAVKAKLLELGTGGSSGFIDDELPDYVMVMVANKRTKQQMNAELNLFLGEQTDLFVTWLHEVLQKLQEVTLPASSATSKKRKSRQAETPKGKEKEKEKDKKGKDKRDKRAPRKSDEDQLNNSAEAKSRTGDTVPAITSITDVFAEELLEKAKKTLDVDPALKDELLNKKKKRKSENATEQPQPETEAQPDVPTTSEISSTTTSGNREKDLAELAEIQRKIYAAKQHLRKIGELENESDDDLEELEQEEDILNLNEQEETPAIATNVTPVVQTRRVKSPIVFNRTAEKPKVSCEAGAQRPSEDRRSVHDRLGNKAAQQPTPPERAQRTQKNLELYVPAHRRRSEQQPEQQERNQRNERQSSRKHEPVRSSRRSSRSPSPKQRIGSRVIVAVNKPPVPSDDEDILEKPVNSVIKIKPRPLVSPRRQACKNLLLRAVADAQRSTILAKTPAVTTTTTTTSKQHANNDEPEIISSTLGKRRLNDSNAVVPGQELFRRSRRELLVNVLQRDSKRSRRSADETQTEQRARVDEQQQEGLEQAAEYVPSLSVGLFEEYVPQLGTNVELEIDMHSSSGLNTSNSAKTQFVVTLNGDKKLGNAAAAAAAAAYRKRSAKRTPSPQVSSTSNQTTAALPSSTTSGSNSGRRNRTKRPHSSSRSSPSTSSNTPPPRTTRSLQRSEILRQPKEVKKLIIKNIADDDEDDEHQQPPATSPPKRASNRKANGHKLEQQTRSTTPPLPSKRIEDKAEAATITDVPTVKAKHTPIRFKLKPEEELSPAKKRRSGSKERDRISIRHAEDKKYDNLPALSAVSVDSAALKVSKPKERCKYHPNCSKQFCEFYHPTAPCKSFPNCKFADKCMYSHPKCKFDLSCISIDCNFAHTGARDLSHVPLAAPPLSSHVIPVQNYKSISAPVTATTATTMCKYYPSCTKVGCTFYHPKPCRYGKNCINKLECIFYHPEMQSKFKWVASLG